MCDIIYTYMYTYFYIYITYYILCNTFGVPHTNICTFYYSYIHYIHYAHFIIHVYFLVNELISYLIY